MNKNWQKFCKYLIYLKTLISKENITINTRNPCKKLIQNSIIEYNKEIKNDFYVVTPEGIKEYRNGELFNVEKYIKRKR